MIVRDSTLGAAIWLVRVYKGRGFDADLTRKALVSHMNEERSALHWQSSLYNVAARYYEEAIWHVYGVRLDFPRAID